MLYNTKNMTAVNKNKMHKKHAAPKSRAHGLFARLARMLSVPLPLPIRTDREPVLVTDEYEEQEQERHEEVLEMQSKLLRIETKLLEEEHEKTELTKLMILISLTTILVALITLAVNILK